MSDDSSDDSKEESKDDEKASLFGQVGRRILRVAEVC